MWAQEMTSLLNDVIPFPNSSYVDVTQALKDKVEPARTWHDVSSF